MSAGLAFDPAEFAAFKSGLSGPASAATPASTPPTADAFDPAEFASFKASRQAPASFSDRFDAAPPMSRAEAAPRVDVSAPGGKSIAQDQKAADALYGGLRRTADEELIGKPSARNTATTALFGAGQGASLNLAGNAAAGIATLLGNYGPAGMGFGDGSRTFAENYDRFQDLQGAYHRQNPKTAVASELAGAVAATPLMPGLPVAEGANIAARATRYGLTGAVYGGAAAAIGTHDPVKALEGAGYGAAGGAILGPVVEKLAPPVVAAASKALEPVLARFGRGAVAAADGFTPEARAALRAAGLDADNLPPQLAQHIETTFAAKGPSFAAAREAQAAEFGLPLSRGQATQDPQALAAEGRALAGQSGPRAQQIGEEFTARQADAVSGARERFLGMAAGDAPRIQNPQAAYEAVADRARQAAQAEAQRASEAQRGLDDALQIVRGRGDVDALDGATLAAQGVRDAAAQGKAGYRAAYDDVAAYPHQFDPGALDMLGGRVRSRLAADVPLDDRLTPAATRAIADLDAVPQIFGLAPGEGPNLQQVDQLRKRLVALYGSTAQNPTDRRALGRVMEEFDNHLSDAAEAGALNRPMPREAANLAQDGIVGRAATRDAPATLSAADRAPSAFDAPSPTGDTAPLEAMQRARGLFREYQQTFKPRGPGDTAGANLRRIVERDASPNEVAAMLFGSTTGRVSPGQMQTLARMREAVGADSEPWAAVQRGLIARHLGGEGQDLGRRLDYLLRGEGRTLTAYLSQEQRAGLGQLRAAVQQAENAGRPTPTWATDLERTGFDPNAVGRSLFGSSGAIGAKPGAAAEARAAKAFLGADSQEWSGLRQAAVQRLLDPATPATKMVAGLRDFTEGAGKGVASTLFNAEELSHFRRLAGALQATVRPDGTIKPGAAGEAGRKAVAKAMDLIAGAIAFKVGGLGAAAGTYGAKVGTRAVMGGLGAASARRSFEGGAPRLILPPPDYAVSAGSAAGRVLEPLGAGL